MQEDKNFRTEMPYKYDRNQLYLTLIVRCMLQLLQIKITLFRVLLKGESVLRVTKLQLEPWDWGVRHGIF